MVASIVPGLGHIRYGSRLTGRLLLGAWACLILGALATLGLDSSQWFLAGVVGVHAAAVIPYLSPLVINSNLFARLVFGLLVFTGLRLGIYYPVGWLGEQFYWTFSVTGLTPGPVVQNEDVLLCRGPWSPSSRTLHRGDVVVYEIPDLTDVLARNAYVRVGRGYGLDRIVGVPGDHVQIVKGQLLVNGRAVIPERAPLGPVNEWEGFDIAAGDDYVIMPARLPSQIHGVRNGTRIFEAMSRVPPTGIIRKVVLRVQPWSRFGSVR